MNNKKKILITGHKGFIGSRVFKLLEEQGHEVKGFDLEEGNLVDSFNSELKENIAWADIVYHIAAQANLNTMLTIEGAEKGFYDNVGATHNVAKLCAKYKKWMVYASTVCVYGNQDVHPESEDETLPAPTEMYACTKYSAEWIVKGYGHNFNMPWTILRFATIYGKGQREVMGVHIFIEQALKGEDITVHGAGAQDRTLTTVGDLVKGITSVVEHPEAQGEIINLSSGDSISAQQVAEDVKYLTDSKSKIVNIEQRPNQTMHEDFDVSKAKRLLGWEAETPWIIGLRESIDDVKEKHDI